MSRRGDGALFIGRLSKSTRNRDLEEIFETYGRMSRCEVKYGAEMAYGFVDYEDRRDAEDAVKYENNRDILGSSIIVEWAKGAPRRTAPSGTTDECYKCRRTGHWARDCPDDRSYGYRRPSSSRRRRSYSPRRRSRSPRRSSKRSRSRSRDRRRSRRSPSYDSKSRSPSKSPRPTRESRSRSRSKDKWDVKEEA